MLGIAPADILARSNKAKAMAAADLSIAPLAKPAEKRRARWLAVDAHARTPATRS